MLALISSLVVAAAHPGLFFSQSDVASLQAAASTTHQPIAAHITTVLDQHLLDPAPATNTYDDARFHGNAVAVWAFGYVITGKTAYADKARQLLLTYVGWSDWGFGETVSLGAPDIATGHMLTGVALAYDWIWSYLTLADRATIATRLATEAQKMSAGLPGAWFVDEYVQNHNWISVAGLGLAALALEGEYPRAAGWLAQADANQQKLTIVLDSIKDGSFHEGLPYEGYGLSMSMPFWVALARHGQDYTDLGILRGFGKYWLYASIPDDAHQVVLPFGDFTGWPRGATAMILRYSAARFHDPIAETAARRWLAAAGRGTFLPEMFYDVFEYLFYDPAVPAANVYAQPLESGFADLGGAVLHSSWDPGDLAVGFKAGPYGGHSNFERIKHNLAPGGWLAWGHDHNDDMSFWLYGKGAWLAPEAMGYTAGVNTGVTNAANATAYHNGLLVDGQGELGDLRSSDSNWNNPWFFQRDATLLVDPAGTAHYSIAGGRGAALYAASLGLTRWDRMVVLAKSRYALVHDDIAAAAAHQFDWLCHFADGVTVDTATGWVKGTAKNGQSLGVRVVSPALWTATTGTQTAELMNLFDSDNSTSFVKVHPQVNAAQVQFLTALVPVATAAWASRPSVDALSAADTGAGAVVAAGSALEERFVFSSPGAVGKIAGDLAVTGALLGVVARDAAGAHRRAALFGAGKIADLSGGRDLLVSTSAVAIEADVQGATLYVTGSGISDFRAWAPSATTLVLNGTPAAATFEAGTVVYPPASPNPPPSSDGGTDAGSADAGSADAGSADAGSTDAGSADAGGTDAGAPGGGATNDGGSVSTSALAVPTGGCSTAGLGVMWPLVGLFALLFRRKRSACKSP